MRQESLNHLWQVTYTKVIVMYSARNSAVGFLCEFEGEKTVVSGRLRVEGLCVPLGF